ncbi:unnamed protein product [Meloidogyne enterolobii]|uniref:Uncharacterized protein n=1 Tax=Meloidogyne enterolobii TaxID=390850 RepID=A0ACB1AZP7_MELEN
MCVPTFDLSNILYPTLFSYILYLCYIFFFFVGVIFDFIHISSFLYCLTTAELGRNSISDVFFLSDFRKKI